MSASSRTFSLRRIAVAMTALALAASGGKPSPARAQTLDPTMWVTNGTVYAVTSFGDTMYVGGSFTEIGHPTGGIAAFDPVTQYLTNPLPVVLGQVHVVISDGAGGLYIGGQFTHVGGQPRDNLAHLFADNSLDSWNPGANGEVYALCRNPNGNLYVGGSFNQVAGTARNRVAEIRTDGTLTSFAPSMDGTVRAIVLSGTDVVLGGDFLNVTGVGPRSHVAMISRLGVTYAWNPGVNGSVQALRVANLNVHGQGVVSCAVVGGTFTTAGGGARNNIAALSLVDGVGAFSSWNPNANGTVNAITPAGTDFYLGGTFTNVGGIACSRIAKVDNVLGTTYATWVPVVDAEVKSIVYRASTNSVLVGGRFTNAGGQIRRGLAELTAAAGGAGTSWNPRPSNDVECVLDDGWRVVAGGIFTAANMLQRFHLASFTRHDMGPTGWNPGADQEVRAIALDVVGTSVRSVIVGGYFNAVGGGIRSKLAALDPKLGTVTSWNPVVAGGGASVRTFCLTGGTLYVGGDFTTLNGQGRVGAGAYTLSTGALTTWNPLIATAGTVVWAMTATTQKVFLGGTFNLVGGLPRNNLVCVDRVNGAVLPAWNASTNDYVMDLALYGGNLYAGGWFTQANSTPRNFAAAFDTSTGTLQSWNPAPDGFVYSTIASGDKIVLGGSFGEVQGQSRRGGARVDPVTAAPDFWSAETDGVVFGMDVVGTHTLLGGAFTNIQWFARSNLADLTYIDPAICGGGSDVIDQPRALATADLNGDGILDAVICHSLPVPMISVALGAGANGQGSGAFGSLDALQLPGTPRRATIADFDADGHPDVAVTANAGAQNNDVVIVYRGQPGGMIGNPVSYSLLGHAEDVAAGDVTNDGILDLAVCLTDSLGFPERGGVQLLQGGGTNGIWDGTFTTAWKAPVDGTGASARRMVMQDFNSDGTLDMVISGWAPGAWRTIKTYPGGMTWSVEFALTSYTPQESGFGIAVGDLDGNGRGDLVITNRRRMTTRMRLPNDDPEQVFFAAPLFNVTLSSTPRDIALLDWDFDGKLDLICVMDSLSRIELYRGVGDGSFDPNATVLASTDAYGLAVGDFVANGSADLLLSQPNCGTLTTIPNNAVNPLPTPIVLTAPNGGEAWAQQPFADGTMAVAPPIAVPDEFVVVTDSRTSRYATASAPSQPTAATTQFISWDKGAGIQTVDVDVSRDGGHSWQALAQDMPGTTLRWIVTPPASGAAKVRVRDALVPSHSDASDATFNIVATTVGVDPRAGLPRVAAIRMAGANPVRAAAAGGVAFRVDVPRRAEVRVDVYDAAGRHVHTVARGMYEAGTHALAWSAGADGAARAGGPRAGLYFVRASVGEADVTSKFVVLP